MTSLSMVEDFTPVGALPIEAAAEKLREVGEDEVADELLDAATEGPSAFGILTGLRLRSDPLWRHTSHAFGYLPPDAGQDVALIGAHSVAGDTSLSGATIKVTLDQLRIADYPGRGTHCILFDFHARNQTDTGAEPVHFNALYRVAEGDRAAVAGRPVFTGLSVGTEGIFLQFVTVNVKNEQDERLVSFLDGDLFRGGLQLLTSAQPALAPFSAMAVSLTKAIAERNRNITVQTVDLGLDFSTVSMRPRLAEGSYFVIQMPEAMFAVWRWEDWVFDRASGRIADRTTGQAIPYNYFVIGISAS